MNSLNEPNVIQLFLHITGAAALLVWAVRLVRTGVERGFSIQMRKWLLQSSKNRLWAAGSGVAAAVLLQSSTAVAVLISNFVSKGGLAAAVGLAVLLGADVGSAVVAQLLMVRQSFLIPLLLLIGITLFLRSENSSLRQVGRIIIGLALIFVSLDMIRTATSPMVTHPGTQVVMAYLGRDLLTAFILGAGFAWVVHSSVAAVLLFVTLAATLVLPVMAAAAMILGANLGGALIAYVLTLSAPPVSRTMIVANLVLRGGGAICMALLIGSMPDVLDRFGPDPARQTINLHLAFNVILVLLTLPIVGPVTKFVAPFIKGGDVTDVGLETTLTLDPNAIDRPVRGLDCVARELLSFGQTIESMLVSVEPLYDEWNNLSAKAIKEQNKISKQTNLDIKLYLAQLGQNGLEKDLSKRSMELAAISSNLTAASDTIARTMLELANRLDKQGIKFSVQGREEIGDFTVRVHSNVQLALNVMMNQNPGEARELVAAKEKIRRVEQKLQRKHLGRLQQGLVESIDTSNVHQETLRALKQINTSFTGVGYAILDKSGDLLKSRLT